MILLFSGGLDSYIAYRYLSEPNTLYCDLGHRYATHEVEAVKKLVPSTVVDARLRLADWEGKNAHIPLRNVFLTMIASFYDKNIALVTQKGEMDLPDRSKLFFARMTVWLSEQWDVECQVTSPFFNMTKTQMVTWYLNKGYGEDKLLETRSCFSAGDLPCGQCAACFRRWVAFTNNEIEEKYESPILEYKGIPDYVNKMQRGKYDKVRTQETFSALKKAGIL